MYRVEDKYQCSVNELRILQEKLDAVLLPDKNQAGTNGYKVTSIYFDDLFDTFLEDTLDGNHLREKYRIRIYNNSFETIKLEVKYKKNNRVNKISRDIVKMQMINLIDGNCIEDKEKSLDSPITLFNLAICERGLRPKVIVEYDRKAYVFDTGNVRITLDQNIRASNQIEELIRDEYIQFDYVRDMENVLEVKYDEFLPSFIAGILETGNMNQVSCSKYRLCREKENEICQQKM